MTIQDIRKQFPALSAEVYGRQLVYFDNAATSQRLSSVLQIQDTYSRTANANIHRAVHHLSDLATEHYEAARAAVSDFIGASSSSEIIFTSGTTASINLVAYSFCEAFVGEGDNVIVSAAEHHSNLVPWQQHCLRKSAQLRFIPVLDDGRLDIQALERLIDERTKILAVTQVSNVLGIVNPVDEIVRICHSKGVPVLVDGAQGIVHCGIDVRKTDCDFYAFSGHKMYAATGTGVLYGKKEYLEKMPPFLFGGEMVGNVSLDKTTFAPLPMKFEAGTQNFIGQTSFIQAIEFMRSLEDEELAAECRTVEQAMRNILTENPRIKLYGTAEPKIPVFSFSVDGLHHEDLALLLDKMGVAVRSGQMCAEPLMDRFGVTGMLRVSHAPYNTLEEVEIFGKALEKAMDMLS
ncbi:MAG: SufS family cysteine desulfurase [Candidatus Cryptobacteroides sp.]|nr:SufS family cysteine desulfurase [Candidatus Cryptobacteroides sp.]